MQHLALKQKICNNDKGKVKGFQFGSPFFITSYLERSQRF